MARTTKSRKRKQTASAWLKEHFVPHAGNGQHPHFFRSASLAAIAIAVLLLQALYFGQTRIVFFKTDFLASVLPGALVALTNDDRAANGVPEVEEDPALSKIAQRKADDMAERGYFSHETPEGHAPWWWLDEGGYQYVHAGENLAVNFTDSKDVEEAWMDSPTHRANIVKPAYTKIGIGVAKGTFKGESAIFVVQMFATPPAPVITTEKPKTVTLLPGAKGDPVAEPERVIASPQESLVETDVLGSESPAPARPTLVRETTNLRDEFLAAISSPHALLTGALYGFMTLTLLAFTFAFLRRLRVPHPGVLVGSTVMTALFLGVLYLNASLIVPVSVPEGTQTANAISAVGR